MSKFQQHEEMNEYGGPPGRDRWITSVNRTAILSKSLWGREPKGVASGRLLGSLLWGKGVCVGRGGGEWEGKIVLTVGLSLQNMSITQELCGYLTLNAMSDDNESVLKDTH